MADLRPRIRAAACALALLGGLEAASAAQIVERIVARVGSDIILMSELDKARQGARLGLEGGAAGQSDPQVLDSLIDNAVLKAEARDQKLEVEAVQVRRALDEIRKRFASEEKFQTALASEGLSETALEEKLQDQLRSQMLVEREVRARQTPVREDDPRVEQFYRDNAATFNLPESVRLAILFLKAAEGDADARAGRRKQLKTLWQKLAIGGGDFAAEAARNGDPVPGLGADGTAVLPVEQLRTRSPEIWAAVSRLEAGQMSDVVEAPEGFYVFRLEERLPARSLALGDQDPASGRTVRQLVVDLVAQKEFAQAYQDWLQKLKARREIVIRD